jgi:sulfite exporter TauE/SafE
MTNLFGVLALGFFLGMRHATDPDHVIAVGTLVARHRSSRRAALIGAVWGLGHTLTVLIVGGGIILLGWVIPVRVGLSLELSVGAMLIVLGGATLARGYRRLRLGPPASGSSGEAHSHPHRHGDYVRPLVVGVVHGLAGSAAVALLVLAAIDDPAWGLVYLAVFGAGTIVGMMLITMAVALPFTCAEPRVGRFGERLRIASGAVSLGFGLFLAYQAGVVHGLFSASPRWIPQ